MPQIFWFCFKHDVFLKIRIYFEEKHIKNMNSYKNIHTYFKIIISFFSTDNQILKSYVFLKPLHL